MNYGARQDRQLRAVATAMFASIAASVAAMFVPVAMLEAIIGATGVSEVFQATAAPLGDTARAFIAFSAGVVTLALMSVLLMRGNTEDANAEMSDWTAAGIPENDDDLTPTWKERFAGLGLPTLRLPQMPWVKGERDITELADLPKLRNGDMHPDAPPRHPLLASQDLPVLDLPASDFTMANIEPVTVESADDFSKPVMPAESVAAVAAPFNDQLSLAEMVAQLEASVSQRQQQLADLEIVAANLAVKKTDFAPVAVEVSAEPEPLPEPMAEQVRPIRPVLEAVPASPSQDDNMDAALAAALATLHRMNGTGG